MKKALISAVASLTLLTGGLAATAITAAPASASQGCATTVEVHNHRTSDITVKWASSDSRAKVWGVAGPWKELGSGTTTVHSGAIGSKAFTLDLSCNTPHQYRVYLTQGSNSFYANYPTSTSIWTTSNRPHLDIY
jgi:hypothetical protein